MEDRPKSRTSLRVISLSDTPIELLKIHQAQQVKDAFAVGLNWTLDSYVFSKWDGTPYGPSAFSSAFRGIVKKAGFQDVRPHDLRHSHNTILFGLGVHPKVVQARSGHSTIATTLDIYTRPLESMDREAAELFEKALSGEQDCQGIAKSRLVNPLKCPSSAP